MMTISDSLQTFPTGYTLRALLWSIYDLQVFTSSDLIPRIHVVHEAELAEASEQGLVARFTEHLFHYLRGVGHPNHSFIRSLVSDEDFNDPAIKDHKGFRGSCLLKAMSGSEMRKPGRAWKLRVCAVLFFLELTFIVSRSSSS